MPGLGQTFVGCIGVGGIIRPTTALTVETSNQRTDRGEVVISPPAGVALGDLMLFTVALIPHFVGFSSRNLPGSVTLLTDPVTSFGAVLIVGYKNADASDVAGSSSYMFTAFNSGGIGYSRATITTFPAGFGTTPTTAQVDITNTPSISPTAGAGWYFAAALSGKPTAIGGSEPTFTMSSTADLLLSSTGVTPQNSTRTYSVDKGISPVAGSYANSPNYAAMSVIGITA